MCQALICGLLGEIHSKEPLMNTKVLATVFMAWTFIFQNVAFAMKPIEVSAQSDINVLKAQKVTEKISNRYEGLSSARKLKLLKRTERRLVKASRKIEKMSNELFQNRVTDLVSQKSNTQKTMKMESEESEILKDFDTSLKVKAVSLDKFSFNQKIEDSIFAIRAEIDSIKNGEKKLTVTKAVILGLIAGLIVLSFFSSVALVILGVLAITLAILVSLFILAGVAFATALGDIVGQMKQDNQYGDQIQ